MNFLSWSSGLSVISIPSIQILPLIFLAILVSPIRRVDLPLPLLPQMATFWRGGMVRVSPAGNTVNTDLLQSCRVTSSILIINVIIIIGIIIINVIIVVVVIIIIIIITNNVIIVVVIIIIAIIVFIMISLY